MRRFITLFAIVVVFAGLAGGLYYVQYIFKPAFLKAIISKPQPPTSVAVEAAKADKLQPRLPSIGTFKAIQGIDIAPEVSGVIKALHIESGQIIAKDAPVIEIDDRIEQADLMSGLAVLKNAEVSLRRQQQLMATNNGTQANLDSALSARDQASASVDKIRAVIAQKAVLAPFSGQLGIRQVNLGQYISAGAPVISLTQLDPIYLDFNLPEQNLDKLKVGETVEIHADAYAGRTFTGKISSIDARVSADTRNVIVRATVPNQDLKLLPGMFANVEVLYGDLVNAVTVPRTGVTFSLYGDSVYVTKPVPASADQPQPAAGNDQVYNVERRFVRTGEVVGDRVVISEGLQAGETIISQGQIKLIPNALVKIDQNAAYTAPTQLPKQ